MKKGLLSLLIGAGILVFLTSEIMYHTGSPGGKTGSPGDGSATCTQCHTGTAISVTGWITTNIPASGYIPGQTYTITATATHTGAALFGFELTAENSSNTKTGTFIITNTTQTKLVNNNKAVTHTQNGTTPSGNSKSWSADWTAPAAGTGNVTFYAAFNAANGNGQNSGDVIYKTTHPVSEGSVLEADFTANPTTVCAGEQVAFTDLTIGNPIQWQWTFEGGTPGVSTQENPSITYNTAGTYDVTLFVSNGSQTDQITKSNYITVLPASPPVPGVPAGETLLCENPQNTTYTTSGSTGATGYTWQLDPVSAGIISGTGTTVTINWADDYTGTASLRVKALNQCGESALSAPLAITVDALPVSYAISGGGAYCQGSSGVEISLAGSETGVQYELYLEGLPTGVIASGTGDAISFENVTTTGTYTIMAMSDLASCTTLMEGSVVVTSIPLPEIPASPQGPVWVDLFYTQESEYSTAGGVGSESYEWSLDPSDAGTISPVSETTVMVTWNAELLGDASLSVRGVNECGPGEWSQALVITVGNTVGLADAGKEISVSISPNPNNGIFKVSLESRSSDLVSFSVMNLLGKTVFEEKQLPLNGTYTQIMELRDIPKGIYIMRVETPTSKAVHKFVIQ